MVSPDESQAPESAKPTPEIVAMPPQPTPLYIANGVRLLPFPFGSAVQEDGSSIAPVATLETCDDSTCRITHQIVVIDGIYRLFKEIERPGGGIYFAEIEEWTPEAQTALTALPVDPSLAVLNRDAGVCVYDRAAGDDTADIGTIDPVPELPASDHGDPNVQAGKASRGYWYVDGALTAEQEAELEEKGDESEAVKLGLVAKIPAPLSTSVETPELPETTDAVEATDETPSVESREAEPEAEPDVVGDGLGYPPRE